MLDNHINTKMKHLMSESFFIIPETGVNLSYHPVSYGAVQLVLQFLASLQLLRVLQQSISKPAGLEIYVAELL